LPEGHPALDYQIGSVKMNEYKFLGMLHSQLCLSRQNIKKATNKYWQECAEYNSLCMFLGGILNAPVLRESNKTTGKL
jgi:hypothetical protein